ncbi:hypothetical protein RRG08_007681, partial [Elysia crispata]
MWFTNKSCISEQDKRLIDKGMKNSDDTYIFYCGEHQHVHGGRLLIKKTIAESLLGVECGSNRNILAKIK